MISRGSMIASVSDVHVLMQAQDGRESSETSSLMMPHFMFRYTICMHGGRQVVSQRASRGGPRVYDMARVIREIPLQMM